MRVHSQTQSLLSECGSRIVTEAGGTPEQLCYQSLTPAWVVASPELQSGSLLLLASTDCIFSSLPGHRDYVQLGQSYSWEGREAWLGLREAGATLPSPFYEEMSIFF